MLSDLKYESVLVFDDRPNDIVVRLDYDALVGHVIVFDDMEDPIAVLDRNSAATFVQRASTPVAIFRNVTPITPVVQSVTAKPSQIVLKATSTTEHPVLGFDGPVTYGTVIVFDDRPDPVSALDPNGTDRYNFPATVTTGPRGEKGPAGPEGPQGPQGPAGDADVPDMPDLAIILENGLV